jgi:BASS family bile acid:Na+ symporter
MTTDHFIKILVMITLIEMMAAIGLTVKLEDIGQTARPALLMRAAIANYACVAIVTVALLLWFAPPPIVSAGFIIVAVCPGAAYGPSFTAIAKGNVAVAVGLMVILTGSSAICAPLLLTAGPFFMCSSHRTPKLYSTIKSVARLSTILFCAGRQRCQ